VGEQLGRRLGEGGSAEVFEWSNGRVVKLFRPEYAFAVDRERSCARAANVAGIRSPEVHGTVEYDERRGIVFERVDGPTLLEQLVQGVRKARDAGAVLADVHLAMHAVPVPDLPDLAAAVRERGLDFPPGDIVFHGDFHPGNVIIGADGAHTIDWANAHVAPRAADVARTIMAVRYQALRGDQPEGSLALERRTRASILESYLTIYLDAAGVEGDLPFWLTQAAGSLLRTEPESADASDLRAFADRRYNDVTEPVLTPLLQGD
jgi:tRNA A-37 threonylcarbamoyl transferase component Bud32